MKAVVDTFSKRKILDVKSIVFCRETFEIVYVFDVDGVDISLKGRLTNNGDIKGINCSDDLEAFLMGLMPIDSGVSKKLSSVTWRYVGGDVIRFPFLLISL